MSVCATCLKPGLPADGRHDCPGLGEIQLTRQRGHGLRVDTAPPRARMALAVLADHGHGLAMQDTDLINIADQVLYQVVGYDPESAALVLELVEDWRPGAAPDEEDEEPTGPAKPGVPRCTATWKTEHQGTARCWRRAIHNQRVGYEAHMGETEQGYRFQWIGTEPGTTPHQSEPADATVCTPIPAETLMQMSEVPPELLTEQQLGRADNALERLRLAREALIRDGYFTADEVGPDIAPRIVEWLSHHRDRVAKAETDLAWQQSVNSDLRVESRARGEKLTEAEDQLRRTRIELEHWQASIVPELRTERDKARAVLREVLAVFATVTSPTSGVPMGYQAPPIHPDDMDRWRAVLDPAAEKPKCGQCMGRGIVPNWQDWNHEYGEPRPKPCPDCRPKEQ